MLRGGLQHTRSFCIFFKILLLTLFAFLIPKIFLRNLKGKTAQSHVFQFCIETIKNNSLERICPADKTIGLLVNDHSNTQNGTHTIDFLKNNSIYPNMIFFSDSLDKKDTTVPTMSWNDMPVDMLDSVDVFFVDIFDYQSNETQILLELLHFALLHNKKVVIFDRPNLCGNTVQGPIRRFKIGKKVCSIPYFHGMTVGELALYCNNYILPKPAELQIIPMNAYKRSSPPFYKKFEMAKLIEVSCFTTKKISSRKEQQQLQSFFSKALTIFLYRPIPQLLD